MFLGGVVSGWGLTLGQGYDASMERSLIGVWVAPAGKELLRVSFNENRTFRHDQQRGVFAVENGRLVMRYAVDESEERVESYSIVLQQGVLTLTGGDLSQPLRFTPDMAHKKSIQAVLRDMRGIKPEDARQRFVTITAVLIIIVFAVILIRILRRISHYLINRERGWFRLMTSAQKARTRTIYSVILNVITYVIIFIAIGRVLAEMGVNTTAYIASLSVLGLAIGFGSQGLVQDLVSGFFIILDNQFCVGDLVEISGQIGNVEEVGLRATRLKNYWGQQVVIPNRAIAVVGNFRRQPPVARIDLAFPDSATANENIPLVHKVARELAVQFPYVILRAPITPQLLQLQTGEVYVRVEFEFWPQQQVVAEREVLPRLRTLVPAATAASMTLGKNQ